MSCARASCWALSLTTVLVCLTTHQVAHCSPSYKTETFDGTLKNRFSDGVSVVGPKVYKAASDTTQTALRYSVGDDLVSFEHTNLNTFTNHGVRGLRCIIPRAKRSVLLLFLRDPLDRFLSGMNMASCHVVTSSRKFMESSTAADLAKENLTFWKYPKPCAEMTAEDWVYGSDFLTAHVRHTVMDAFLSVGLYQKILGIATAADVPAALQYVERNFVVGTLDFGLDGALAAISHAMGYSDPSAVHLNPEVTHAHLAPGGDAHNECCTAGLLNERTRSRLKDIMAIDYQIYNGVQKIAQRQQNRTIDLPIHDFSCGGYKCNGTYSYFCDDHFRPVDLDLPKAAAHLPADGWHAVKTA